MKIIILLSLLLTLSACVTPKPDSDGKKTIEKQCKQQITSLKNEIKSCQRYLKLYRNNQESYKKSTDKGFE